eukprot:GEMP01020283.1.p1 GENE.GEMP01020283.1~~GEMP01020283.1.p1  ORF type:complete len:556 (-),score=91.17 GEMP01020283.1:687-2354(-)
MQAQDMRAHHVVTRHEVVYAKGMHALPGVSRRDVPTRGCPTTLPATVPTVLPSAMPCPLGAPLPAHHGHNGQAGSPVAYNPYFSRVHRTAGELRSVDSQSQLRLNDDSNPSNVGLAPSTSYSFLPVTRTPQVTWRSIPAQKVEHSGDVGELQNGHQVRRQASASALVPGAQHPTPRQRLPSTTVITSTSDRPKSMSHGFSNSPKNGSTYSAVSSALSAGEYSNNPHLQVPTSSNPPSYTTYYHADYARKASGSFLDENLGARPRVIPEEEVWIPESRHSEDVKFEEINLVESLGSGEFGHVFRGSWRGQEVAIKQLFWDGSCKTDTLQELRREVDSFRNLKHSRLVKFVGACFDPPHLCLLTEYMSYGSLYHALHVTKLKFPFRNACNMSLQLAEGVTFLHCQMPIVVHRDLKSLNVVLDMHFNIKICDFGLTEIMERTHITKKNNGGSPRYMAPELFDKKSKITEKIDVWAMGCIFSEIFGGKIPYAGVMDLPDLTRNILLYKKLPEIPNNENCPAEVQQVIASCLTYDGEHRPRSKDIFDRLRQVKKMHSPPK